MNETKQRRPWIAGVVLISVGVLLLADEWLAPSAWMVLAGISAVFLALFASTRAYGFLVPGMILAGLAFGTGVQDAGYDERGATPVIGLGLGFLAIYLVNLVVARGPAHWWPLIPGGILTMIGSTLFFGGSEAVETVWRFWPLVLVIAGVIILGTSAAGRRDTGAPATRT